MEDRRRRIQESKREVFTVLMLFFDSDVSNNKKAIGSFMLEAYDCFFLQMIFAEIKTDTD